MNRYYKLEKAFERSNKQEYTYLDIVQAGNFCAIKPKYRNFEHGHSLTEKTESRVIYAKHVSQLSSKHIKNDLA